MTQTLYISIAMAIGIGTALQTVMLSSVGRSRGPVEAAWISLLATICGVSLVFGIKVVRGDDVGLPEPFNRILVFVAIALVAAVALVLSLRGLDSYLALTGLYGLVYLISAGFLAPKIGIALFASAVTAGTLLGSVAADHVGLFGVDIHRLSLFRILGVFCLLLGVLLVRSGR